MSFKFRNVTDMCLVVGITFFFFLPVWKLGRQYKA